jgi:hypothetical protein
MPNPKEWIKANGKNVRKDIIKRVILIGMAIDAAAKGTKIDPNKPMRMLANDSNIDIDNMDFGDLKETVALWKKFAKEAQTDGEKYEFIKAHPEMIGEVPF